jgi:hypothetical protein
MDTLTQEFVDKLKTDPNIIEILPSTPTKNMIEEIKSYYEVDPSMLFLFDIFYRNPNNDKKINLHLIIHEDTYVNFDDIGEYEPSFLLWSNIDNIDENVYFLDPNLKVPVQLRGHSITQSIHIPQELISISSDVLNIKGVYSTAFYDYYDSNNILFCVITSNINRALSPIEYLRSIYDKKNNTIQFIIDKNNIISKQEIIDIVNTVIGN